MVSLLADWKRKKLTSIWCEYRSIQKCIFIIVETIEITTNTAKGICKDKSDSPKLWNKKRRYIDSYCTC